MGLKFHRRAAADGLFLGFANFQGRHAVEGADHGRRLAFGNAVHDVIDFLRVTIALAGIQNIDEQLYEAAKVDGASSLRRVWHITLPMLSPTLFFLVVVNVITSLQAFGEINILTDGGPGEATTNLVYSVFVDAFVGTSFRGLASAQAFLLALLIIIISFAQCRGLGKRVHYG